MNKLCFFVKNLYEVLIKMQLILQDIFLNYLRREKYGVSITLSNGEIVNGIIHGFDGQTIILNQDNGQILIYKANILFVYSDKYALMEKENENC